MYLVCIGKKLLVVVVVVEVVVVEVMKLVALLAQ